MHIADIKLWGEVKPIKGKVLIKCNKGTYGYGEGGEEMFSFIIRDEYDGDIEISVFGREVVNKLFKIIQLYHDYEIDKYTIHSSKQKYNKASGHACCLKINYVSCVTELGKLDLKVKPENYDVTPISSFDGKLMKGLVNTVGVLVECEDSEVAFVDGREETVRGIHIADKSGCRIRVRLWAYNAREFQPCTFNPKHPPIVLVRNVEQTEFNRKCILATVMNSMIIVNPTETLRPESLACIQTEIEALQDWIEEGVVIDQIKYCSIAASQKME